MKSLRTLLLLILAGLVGNFPALAAANEEAKAADEEAKAEALRAFQKGMAHYQLNEFDQAIEAFEAGYRTVPQAVFLYNIGQAYRMSNRPQKAIEFYRKYLRQDPGARNFREVQERIEALEKLVAESQKAPEHPLPPDPALTPEPPPAPLIVTAEAKPQPPPKRRRVWPIVLGVVGGVVVVGAAVGLGVYFGTTTTPTTPVWQAVTP